MGNFPNGGVICAFVAGEVLASAINKMATDVWELVSNTCKFAFVDGCASIRTSMAYGRRPEQGPSTGAVWSLPVRQASNLCIHVRDPLRHRNFSYFQVVVYCSSRCFYCRC